ncbi:MAG: hypothetical protein K9L64_04995 [Candidatus Izimaplasma sp.]|nr:hypothetical protein [Candidatus Izimaplasma bacterium]
MMRIDFRIMRFISIGVSLAFSVAIFLIDRELMDLIVSLIISLSIAILVILWLFWSYLEINIEKETLIYRRPFGKKKSVYFSEDYCVNVYVNTVIKGNNFTKEQIDFIAELYVEDKYVLKLEKNDLGYSFSKFDEYQFIDYIIDNTNSNVVGYNKSSYYNKKSNEM